MTATASRPLRRRNRPLLRIGLTPLIDVIFILLIFFMLASRLDQWNAIEVEIATPAHSDQSETTVRHLLLKAHGRAALDGRTMALSDAQEHLAASIEESIEVALNQWNQEGWIFDQIHFVVRENSRRPSMAYMFFVRESDVTTEIH